MKFLFVTTGSSATFYAVAPLATAVRNAGHEIILAAHEPWMETVEAIGVPTVCYSPKPIRHFMTPSRSEEMPGVGRGFARMASAGLGALLDLAEHWRPDLVVGSSMSFAAGLLATRLKVPYVRQDEYPIPMAGIDPGAEEELRPELDRLGLAGLPEPARRIGVTPPSLQPSPASGGQPMRWIPGNPQRRLEPWMYTRPEARHRVLITSEFRSLPGRSMRHLAGQLTLGGAEVLIEGAEGTAARLRAELSDVRVGWMPVDVVAPACDLAVNHGGAAAAMTLMTAGVPQLIIPPNDHTEVIAQALSGFGAALTVMPQRQEPGQDLGEVIAAGCREILSTLRYTRQARALATEIAALPAPCEVVHTLETLSAARQPVPGERCSDARAAFDDRLTG
jgi:UDP:flavonoid glycosyltransferase YjiC (YdhE family)